ncbi:MAG: thioesterase family protein [Defluviitaleaceae bacterium]|nr:thioesterase family protein [Defluviitaleaceae bacterium]
MTGKTATATTTVSEKNTAKAVGSGNLDVFSTPMMIALMEQAACECLADILEPGQSSVGTQISVAHTAASPLGAKITATATITQAEGRKISFAISATDDTGEIGNGTHDRFIIDADRFMGKLAQRK